MRVELRETGSIRVSARKDRVLEVLQRHVLDGAMRGDRIESASNTYVVREREDGTHVFHMRRGNAPVALAGRDREALRQAVAADLFELQRVLEINQRLDR